MTSKEIKELFKGADTGTIFTSCLVILFMLAILYFVLAWLLALAWNLVAPLFWESAPVLSTWHGLAAIFIINILFAPFKRNNCNAE